MVSSISNSLAIAQKPANFDEVAMQQSLLFSDSLKDLKNLRAQLYSAAEYFELSYNNDDQKRMVMETLKDYAIKAIVNTVDHLGSITSKINDVLDEKFDEVSATEVRVACLHQRLGACHKYINGEGLSQQSLVINAPKYHKRYILPVGESMLGGSYSKLSLQGRGLDDDDDWHQFRTAVRATICETPSFSARKECTLSPSPRSLQRAATFMFVGSTPKHELEKRTTSPYRFPLLRYGSLSSRPSTPNSRSTTPNSSRPTTPNASFGRRRYPSEPRNSPSTHMGLEKERVRSKELEHYPSKSKRLFKALLSRRKSKKDEMLYTFLDEY